jgi:diacylglycerol O-acyltransferase
MDRLTANDLMMVWPEDFGWPQDIAALLLLEGESLFDADRNLRLAELRRHIGSRLHLVPRFRQVLLRPRLGLGWPLWADARAFELAHHVRSLELPAPGDEAVLLQTWRCGS